MFTGIWYAILCLLILFLIGIFIGKTINPKIYLFAAIIGFIGGKTSSYLDEKEREERYEYRHSISGAKDEINKFINGYKNCILKSKRGNNSDKRLNDRMQCYNYYKSEMNSSYWKRKFSERDFSDSELNQLINYFDNQWESQIEDNPDLD